MQSGAHLSRFVLLSAALHIGILAALGYNAVRPTFSNQTLTVNLFDSPAKSLTTDATHSRVRKILDLENKTSPQHPATKEKYLSRVEKARASNNRTFPVSTKAQPEPTSQQEAFEHAETAPSTPAATTPTKLVPPMTEITNLAQDNSALSNRIEAHLRHAITTHFSYPLLARRNGWQGEVQVGLRVEANGRLSHLHIAHSSGYGLLDDAALAALNRIAGLPEAADWLAGRHFDMVVPIEYRLLDEQS